MESFEFEGEGEYESVFSEEMEAELAAELLEITNEAELNQFLGKLIKSAGRSLGKVVRGPIGQALGSALKKVAKTALPMAGAALGNLIVPGIGGVIGGKLASAAGSAFGLELEGLSHEDQEFEVARRYVRLAGAATQGAVAAPQNASPQRAVQAALSQAARMHAPGLAAQMSGRAPSVIGTAGNGASVGHGARPQRGTWYRRGRRIILTGI
ncbi:hypothetical protein HKW67_09330 [Gemmatimonas groenlandica]|uniref:Uncharacterized protein n=2 Tax=Gemmatimonas groenlandica TaxID=2732249 RepID=A0A6M4IWV8_9BACT|nr:hypothetical protein HKW67_09330 [Gemmatimonas groenlandica]